METIKTYTPSMGMDQYYTEYARMVPDSSGEWVRYDDYKKLLAYADKLAEGLPCLPKDIEVLRSANAALAQRVHDLESLLHD